MQVRWIGEDQKNDGRNAPRFLLTTPAWKLIALIYVGTTEMPKPKEWCGSNRCNGDALVGIFLPDMAFIPGKTCVCRDVEIRELMSAIDLKPLFISPLASGNAAVIYYCA